MKLLDQRKQKINSGSL